jgi:hypothetical protein
MKTLFVLLLTLSINTFASEIICKYQQASDFFEVLSKNAVKPIRVARDHKRFSSVEKQLIYKMVTQQEWLRNSSLSESLELFNDLNGANRGPNAGEIKYFNIGGVQYLLVHYWPLEREFGVWFKINKNGSIKLVAVIDDSFIICK